VTLLKRSLAFSSTATAGRSTSTLAPAGGMFRVCVGDK
jgi:hypothetical protein